MPRRREFLRRMCALSVGFCSVIACGFPQACHAENNVAAATLTSSESYRQEIFSRSLGNGSETISTSSGKLTINAELAFMQKEVPAFKADTPVGITVGSFTFQSTLGADPEYRPGNTSAHLIKTLPVPKSDTRIRVGTVEVRWSRDKVIVKVEAKLPMAGKPIAAEDFLPHHEGAIDGETNASLRIGDFTAELNVELKGRVHHRVSSSGFDYGEVITVDLRGKAAERREKSTSAPSQNDRIAQ